MNILKYKSYEGTAEIDMDRQVCRGKILFINDLVTYEAASPKELQSEFEAAVDDYLETCEELGRDAQKPLKGQFNVRIPPQLHKLASIKAVQNDISLNDVVVKALESYLNSSTNINHSVKVTVDIQDEQITRMIAGANTKPVWDVLNVCH
jgi:predicted HicB family RNase H-like nuclease